MKPESLTGAHIIHGAGLQRLLKDVFAAHEWSGEPEHREPCKHAAVGWIDVDAAPVNFVDITASTLHPYLGGNSQISADRWN